MTSKVEFGDWQTNEELSLSICRMLYRKGVRPQVLIEPTCGYGSFVKSALSVFDTIEDVYCIDINSSYIKALSDWCDSCQYCKKVTFHIYYANVFEFDFSKIKTEVNDKRILLLGNPPWVNNSKLGKIGSSNLPTKSNFNKLKGLDAITGKSNFDIAEYITTQLIATFGTKKGNIAFLLKNSVIRHIIQAQPKNNYKIAQIEQYNINAKKEFDASVSASLFFANLNQPFSAQCKIYDFYDGTYKKEFGWSGNKFVSDTSLYAETKDIDGMSPFVWRSGVKHDCSKIMELKRINGTYINGLNEIVDVEHSCIYPLIKSSDIKAAKIDKANRFIIITQRRTSDNTELLSLSHPKLFAYLSAHETFFNNRASVIYKRSPRFSMFGIGDYSFLPYKVIVSSLYKNVSFAYTELIEDKPAIVDDTCYSIGFRNKEDAEIVADTLNSDAVKKFIYSIVFEDAKRIVNKDILMRINLLAAQEKGAKDDISNELATYIKTNYQQLDLFAQMAI